VIVQAVGLAVATVVEVEVAWAVEEASVVEVRVAVVVG